ncbi:hypothetical protein ACWOC1_03745 [Enterococcus quebecensis]|uniref:hypothetical protein n=1 Tax=Enterococcus quebecensis TaxID=903983 RepID=UPI00092250C2|nr:hypothetical protein [Enterococcus quebecensis]OJG71052.1 hypothetical protein RV12_GL001633 [Enterococcus quebecensis]
MNQEEILNELESKLESGEVKVQQVQGLKQLDEATLEEINAGWKCVINIWGLGFICN